MKIKALVILLLIVSGIAVLVSTASKAAAVRGKYESLIAAARDNAARDIPYTAYQKFSEALAIKHDDIDVYTEYLTEAEKLGDKFYAPAVETYIRYFPDSAQAYETLCRYYTSIDYHSKVIETADTARLRGAANEEIKRMYYDSYYTYRYISKGYEEAQSFLDGYAVAAREGEKRVINESGALLFTRKYIDISPFVGGYAAVFDGKDCYMINTLGYKVASPDKPVDRLSFTASGKIRVTVGDRCGYVDTGMKIPDTLPYEDASNYKFGIAAVKKNGKWALINTGEETITDYVYDEIRQDEYGTVIANNVVFAKRSDRYEMLDETGSSCSDSRFDDVYPFLGSEPAAVCIDGKWGFIDKTGQWIIEPQYENAKSFSNAVAPICRDGKWGYIDINGEMRIDCIFEDCLPFTADGIAAVKENGEWNYIRLTAYIQ